MNPGLPDTRITLSYEGATYKRALICASICVVTIIIFVSARKVMIAMPPGSNAYGPSGAGLISGCVIFFSLFTAISEALFVSYFKFFARQIECDGENLYIKRQQAETTIPLGDITTIRLTTTWGNGIRGNFVVYRIAYVDNGEKRETRITVYSKMGHNFDQFEKRVKARNPSVEIKNWATSFDGVIRWFRKRRQGNVG
jgi:hypothetical protein